MQALFLCVCPSVLGRPSFLLFGSKPNLWLSIPWWHGAGTPAALFFSKMVLPPGYQSVLLPRLAAEWDAAFLAPLSSLPPNSSKQTFCILRLFWWETDGDNKVMKTCESSKKKKFPSFANHSVILNTSWHGNGKCLQFSTLFSFSTSHFACNHPISHTHTHF